MALVALPVTFLNDPKHMRMQYIEWESRSPSSAHHSIFPSAGIEHALKRFRVCPVEQARVVDDVRRFAERGGEGPRPQEICGTDETQEAVMEVLTESAR